MRTPILLLVILASAAIGGTVVYFFVAPKTSAPVAVTAPATVETQTATPQASAPTPAPSTPVPAAPVAAAPAANAAPTAPAKSEAEIAFGKLMDKLVSTNLSAADKHNLFEQLRKNHQLDQAIADLQQRQAADPNNPEISTTIGEAQLNKLRDLRENGDTDTSDLGILAMEADQNFNAALKIDPNNFEAQLVKNISISYWPPNSAQDAQAIQSLTGAIDQEENMPSDPGFAQTYAALVREYQKTGDQQKAQATLQLGLQKFPNDPILQQMASGAPPQQ